MLSKTRRIPAAKPAARRKSAKKAKPAAEITPEEVVSLELDAARASRSERAWLRHNG